MESDRRTGSALHLIHEKKLSGLQPMLPLLESIVRGRVRALAGVGFLEGYDIVGLTATADGRRVTGARVRAGDGVEETVEADVVVDTTGRGSRAALWLDQLGHGRPVVEKVQVGLGYATRTYRLPEGAMGKDQVMLVTSGLHLRRSMLYFSHFGVRALPARGDYVGAAMNSLPLAHNFLLMDLTLHEYAGLLRYHVYEMLGWNIEARHPGAL